MIVKNKEQQKRLKMTIKKKVIIVITDPGEEIDDETAIEYLINQCRKDKSLNLIITTVGGKMSSLRRFGIIQTLFNDLPSNVMITLIENIVEFKSNYFQKYDERYVLQIGPCDYLHVAHHLQSALNQYHYLILGMIGGSVNAKSENEVAFATTLYDGAITKNVIQTKFNGETVVPSYNKKIIDYFSPKLGNEILKLGFKFTLGRAPPLPFTAHLVGPNGGSYNTVKSLFDTIKGQSSFDSLEISDQSLSISNDYFSAINSNTNPGAVAFREKQYEMLHQSNESQILGLARMIEANSALFGINKMIIFSNDPIFENIETSTFSRCFNDYINMVELNESMNTTPCYDLIAAFGITALIRNDYTSLFDENGVFKHYQNSDVVYQLLNM